MKLAKFEVLFEPRAAVFEAGGLLSGTVNVHFEKPVKVRCIQIVFEGKCKTHWEVRSGKSTTKYRGHEGYLNTTAILFQPGQGCGDTAEHPTGFHSYQFSINLPSTIPSSFEGRKGYVRYTCKAVIVRPWKFNESIKKAFTVIHHLDLNMLQEALIPMSLNKEKDIEGCCCNEGRISISLDVPKRGFVPGESLMYKLKVVNSSDNDIEKLNIFLKQKVCYTGYSDSIFSSGNPHTHEKKAVFTLRGAAPRTRKGETLVLEEGVIIPSLPPSKLDGCTLIDIRYELSVALHCGWTTVSETFPLFIGTIPVRQMPSAIICQPPPSFQSVIPSAPPPTGEFSAIAPPEPPPYSEPPPPSYAECVFGHVSIRDEQDDDHTHSDQAWAPVYPYYNWSQNSGAVFGQTSVPQHMPPPAYED